MSFFAALRWYILLLFVGVLSLLLVLPKTLRLDFGKHNLCRIAHLPKFCTQIIPLPERIPLTITRPTIDVPIGSSRFTRSLDYTFGLDIAGGAQTILAIDMSEIEEKDRATAHESAKEIILRRMQFYGIDEATVVTARAGDEYRLHVSVIGDADAQDIAAIIGSTAQIDFREYIPEASSPSAVANTASPSGQILVKDFVRTDLTGKDIQRSLVVFDPQTGDPVISLQMTSDGAKKLEAITKRSIDKPLAIFLDTYPISAPKVQRVITDGVAQIRGKFSLPQARSLTAVLNAGALPAPIRIVSQKTVASQLGTDAVQKLVLAGVFGFLSITAFLLATYRLAGLLATVSLLFFILLTLTLYKLIPITITIPGIAGFLLSIALAVDTHILVFERMKEEMEGIHSTLASLLQKSFTRTFAAIQDANVLLLATSFILANPFGFSFLNTSSLISGFAAALVVGIILNIFCGLFVTKVFMTLFYRPTNKD